MNVTWNSCQRIGHGGASALAPANTLASFDAAFDVGIDMVEFDVRGWQRELILAHTALDARRGAGIGLREALAHLSTARFTGLELNVDLKHPGCEAGLLEELGAAGLLERTLISSQVPVILDRVRLLEPRARIGISVGGRLARMSRRWRDWRRQVLAGLAHGRWDVLMAQYRLVDQGLIGDVEERGGRLYAWTVNQRPLMDHLREIGVHGITTADPRLFA